MTRVMGLDLSLTASGMAFPDGRLHTLQISAGRKDRLTLLRETFRELIVEDLPDVAVIESYAIIPNRIKSMISTIEAGGVAKEVLQSLGIPYVTISPSSLKGWATGHGGASKDDMVRVAKLIGGHPKDDNQADAFFLKKIGDLHYSNQPAGRTNELINKGQKWPQIRGNKDGAVISN